MVTKCTITLLKYTVSRDTKYMSAPAFASLFLVLHLIVMSLLLMLCINVLFLLLFRESALQVMSYVVFLLCARNFENRSFISSSGNFLVSGRSSQKNSALVKLQMINTK